MDRSRVQSPQPCHHQSQLDIRPSSRPSPAHRVSVPQDGGHLQTPPWALPRAGKGRLPQLSLWPRPARASCRRDPQGEPLLPPGAWRAERRPWSRGPVPLGCGHRLDARTRAGGQLPIPLPACWVRTRSPGRSVAGGAPKGDGVSRPEVQHRLRAGPAPGPARRLLPAGRLRCTGCWGSCPPGGQAHLFTGTAHLGPPWVRAWWSVAMQRAALREAHPRPLRPPPVPGADPAASQGFSVSQAPRA